MPTDSSTTYDAYTVRSYTNFDALRPNAGQLCVDNIAEDTFYSWAWYTNLSSHGIDLSGGLLLVLVQHEPTGRQFCLPLVKNGTSPAPAYGLALKGLSNYYSSLYGPIGALANCTVNSLRAVLRHLRSGSIPCDVIDLNPLDATSPFAINMRAALRAEGWLSDTYLCFGNWHLDVAGRSFEAYYPSIPSRLRNTIKRGRSKLDKAGDWGLRVHTSPGPEMDAAIADFVAVYRKSWKVPEPYPRFVPELCRMAAQEGWIRLGVLRQCETAIAAQLWLVRDGRALIYKLAYDEEFKRFSAGSVLSAEMMRHAIDQDGVVEVDYLTGDDGYKVDWMSHRRQRIGLLGFRVLSAQGLSSALRHLCGRLARQVRPSPKPAAVLAKLTRHDAEL